MSPFYVTNGNRHSRCARGRPAGDQLDLTSRDKTKFLCVARWYPSWMAAVLRRTRFGQWLGKAIASPPCLPHGLALGARFRHHPARSVPVLEATRSPPVGSLCIHSPPCSLCPEGGASAFVTVSLEVLRLSNALLPFYAQSSDLGIEFERALNCLSPFKEKSSGVRPFNQKLTSLPPLLLLLLLTMVGLMLPGVEPWGMPSIGAPS